MPTMNLPTLLLTQLDRGLSPTIDAHALAPYPPKVVKELCRRKILAPLPRLTVVDPCGDCEGGCVGRTVVERHGKPYAVCPNGRAEAQTIDPLCLDVYAIDEKEFCLQLRQGNGLVGEGIEALSGGLWLLGRDDQQMPVFMLFRCAETTAAVMLGAVSSFTGGQKAVIWLPSGDVLPFATRNAVSRDLMFRDLSLEFDPSETAPLFRLKSHPEKASTEGVLKPVLIINADSQTVRFRDVDVTLGPVVFRLLLALAEQAVKTSEPLSSTTLIKKIWGAQGLNDDLRNNLRRLREGFKKAMGGSFDPKSIIHHNQKTGTRLAIPSQHILITGNIGRQS